MVQIVRYFTPSGKATARYNDNDGFLPAKSVLIAAIISH
jgi:hypothetical protein